MVSARHFDSFTGGESPWSGRLSLFIFFSHLSSTSREVLFYSWSSTSRLCQVHRHLFRSFSGQLFCAHRISTAAFLDCSFNSHGFRWGNSVILQGEHQPPEVRNGIHCRICCNFLCVCRIFFEKKIIRIGKIRRVNFLMTNLLRHSFHCHFLHFLLLAWCIS